MTAPRKPLLAGIYMRLTEDGRQKLKKLMDAHDVTQRELAQVAGWASHSYLGRLLRGEENTLSPGPALRIAEHFSVDVNAIFVAKLSTDTGQIDKRESAA